MGRSDRVAYYERALDFWLKATRIQRQRCIDASPSDTHARADISFYVVAVQRVREVARMAADRASIAAAREALAEFDTQWPQFAELRNDDEHIRGPENSTTTMYFPHAVADLLPGGRVKFRVHVQDTQEDVERLASKLVEVLSASPSTST